MPELGAALTRAIGKAALAKHLESCTTCADDYECAVAAAHRRTLASIEGAAGGDGR
jgi:hypothetical protein